MSRSVNKVILIGHLGQDAEMKHTPGGAAVTNFTLATGRRWKDKNSDEWREETEWHRITLWQAEGLSAYLKKGTQVYIEGRLHTRSYDKDGQKHYATDVIADTVNLLGGNAGGSDAGERPAAGRDAGVVSRPRGSAPPQRTSAPLPDLEDDSIPF